MAVLIDGLKQVDGESGASGRASGALRVRGTVDGAQLAALTGAHRRATRARAAAEEAPGDAPSVDAGASAPMGERLLELVAPYPFLFGCVFALGATWPPRDPQLPGPGEPWPPQGART